MDSPSPSKGQRQDAETLLRQERLFSEEVLNSLPGILYLYNEQRRFLRWSRSFETISEYSHEEIAQIDPLDFFAGAEKQIIDQKINEVFSKGEASVEADFVTKSGRAIPFFLTGRRILFEGKPCVIGMGIDISVRRHAEQALRQSEQKYRELVQHANSIILRWTRDGRITFLNEFGLKFFGYTAEEIIGQHVMDTIVPESDSANRDMRHLMEQILADPVAFEQNTNENIRRDGERVWIAWTNKTVLDEFGRIREVLSIGTDITEKKKIEAQFLRSQRMESIGTLAGGIAHDLNNILTPIMVAIELLKETATDEESSKILQTIGVSARRGADIVRQVLSFARGIEGQRVEIQSNHLIKDLAQIMRDTFPKDIRLDFFVPDSTWTILGDPTQVHQVLLNLCVNARDAMPHGGLKVDVENCVLDAHYAATNLQAKAGRYVRIAVTDSGMGIPQENLDKIYEPFFTTKELNKGTGLGLSTVMAIVKSHNGLINAYSEVGKGTVFHVYFPAMEVSHEARKEQLEEASLPRGQGELILLVDDEASIRSVTGQTLEAFGYRVVTASDGAEALAVYAKRAEEIALVITDMRMPVLGGAQMIQALLRFNPALKIIASSGLDVHGEFAQYSGPGVTHFLMKPYTAELLLKTMRATLEER